MATLAQIDIAPAADRGPDARLDLSVPSAWLAQAATIQCELPRKALCAQCVGGGCDRCGRSGAIVLVRETEKASPLLLHLSANHPDGYAVRIAERGGAGELEQVAGCLVIHLRPGEASRMVQRVEERTAQVAAGPTLRWNSPVTVLVVLLLLMAVAARFL